MNQRAKGNNYERELAKFFRELGYSNCTTARFSSKETDDSGVDLCGTGIWQVQAKAWERAPAYHDVLARMPDKKGIYNIIIHKKSRKGEVVVMTKETFKEILDILISNKIVKPK